MQSIRRVSFNEIAAVVLVVLFLGSSDLIYPFGKDHGEYAYLGSAYLEGKIIYKEVFNTKPPLTHILHALALRMFGHSMLSIRLLDLLWQCVTAVVILQVTNIFYNRKYIGVLSASIYLFYYYLLDFWNSAQTDGFINLPVSLSILTLLLAREKEKPLWWMLSGILLSVSALLKYPLGIFLFIMILLVLLPISKQKEKNYVYALYIIGGFLIPLLIFVLSLAADGTLGSFFYSQLNYINRYTLGHSSTGNYFSYGIYLVGESFNRYLRSYRQLNFAYILAPFIILCEILYLYKKKKPVYCFLIIFWWVGAVMHLVVQNKYFFYHRLPIYAPQSIVVSHLFFIIYDKLRKYPYASLLRGALIGFGLLLFCMAYFDVGYQKKPKKRKRKVEALGYYLRHKALLDIALGRTDMMGVYKDPRLRFGAGDLSVNTLLEVSEYIKKRSDSTDKIFFWGFNPGVYFLSERDCASRFINNFFLYGKFAWVGQFREIFLKELMNNKPEYILVADKDRYPKLTGTPDSSWKSFKKFTRFYNFVQQEYDRSIKIEDITIFKRKVF